MNRLALTLTAGILLATPASAAPAGTAECAPPYELTQNLWTDYQEAAKTFPRVPVAREITLGIFAIAGAMFTVPLALIDSLALPGTLGNECDSSSPNPS